MGLLLPAVLVVALVADLLLVPALAQVGWLRFRLPPADGWPAGAGYPRTMRPLPSPSRRLLHRYTVGTAGLAPMPMPARSRRRADRRPCWSRQRTHPSPHHRPVRLRCGTACGLAHRDAREGRVGRHCRPDRHGTRGGNRALPRRPAARKADAHGVRRRSGRSGANGRRVRLRARDSTRHRTDDRRNGGRGSPRHRRDGPHGATILQVLGDSDWTDASVRLRTGPKTQGLITLSAGPLESGAADFTPRRRAVRRRPPLGRSPVRHRPPAVPGVTVDGTHALPARAGCNGRGMAERSHPVEFRAGFARLPVSDPDVRICTNWPTPATVLASAASMTETTSMPRLRRAARGSDRQLHLGPRPSPGGAHPARGAPSAWSGARAGDDRPDIVLFIIDTLAADHTGIGGRAPRPTTPTLDAFAQRNIRYLDATTPAGWTEPSMGSLVTGVLPSTHRAGYRRERIYRPISRKNSSRSPPAHLPSAIPERPDTRRAPPGRGYLTEASTRTRSSAAFGFARGYDRYDKFAGKRMAGAKARPGHRMVDLAPSREQRPPAFLMMLVWIDPYHYVPALEGFEPPPDSPARKAGRASPATSRPSRTSRVESSRMARGLPGRDPHLDDEVGAS